MRDWHAAHSVFQSRSRSKAAPYKFVPLKISSSDEVKWRGVRSCSQVGNVSKYGAWTNNFLPVLIKLTVIYDLKISYLLLSSEGTIQCKERYVLIHWRSDHWIFSDIGIWRDSKTARCATDCVIARLNGQETIVKSLGRWSLAMTRDPEASRIWGPGSQSLANCADIWHLE